MRLWILLVVATSGCAPTPQADHRAGRHAAAAEGFRDRVLRGDTSALAAYNLGTSLLRLGEHATARGGLESAASRAPHPELRFAAEFNAGSADLEPALAASAPDTAALHRAIARYRAALRLRPSDMDAKWNLELAERALVKPLDPPPDIAGGGEDPQEAPAGQGRRPADESSAGPGNPGLSREEADRILSAADREERAVQRRRVQPAPSSARAARDW